MIRRVALAIAAMLCVAALPGASALSAPPLADGIIRSGSVYAVVTDDALVLGNPLVERSWARDAFVTTSLIDKRGEDESWSAGGPDFSITIGATELTSDLFAVEAVEVVQIDGGLRLVIDLSGPGVAVTRIVETYNGIAGFRSQTTIKPLAALAVGGATLERAAVGSEVAATIHAFRAGADWRGWNEDEQSHWTGPDLAIGDPHAGTWRDSHSGAIGEPVTGAAQWISVQKDDRSLFMVMERNDFPSSRAAYDGDSAALVVDHSRDIVSLGPFEENAHAENPTGSPGRHRVIAPGGELKLEPTFLGFGKGAGDEPWQFFKYLTEHRLQPYDHDVTFNSNGTDSNQISTGAKDDMNFETIVEVAPLAKRLGVETFILDDGWQAISGDWQPDSPEFPEPRWDGEPGSKFAPRFPDSEFEAVREAIAPMELGLWMSPMHFNHNSQTYRAHPEWGCTPVGQALVGANAADPDSSSNEAGIATWGPDVIPHIETRLEEAIEEWGVQYFKFDFLVWLDCLGQGDLYDYRDRFVAMLDRLRAAYPHVTFQIDETNDYRLFPFGSVTRGPSWFQNGSPPPEQLLHNIWNLSPWIPAASLGQHSLGGRAYERHPVATLMAAALTGHITFFTDLREVPPAVIDEAAPWIAFYRQQRDLFTQMIYPLLADPLEKQWTALQSWNPEEARGALLVFRQDSDESTTRVALQNVPAGKTFAVRRAPDLEPVGTFTSEQLSNGVEITLPDKRTAEVWVIVPHEG
ncbi:MAG: alpha-galactosidase [Actinomycetota bacterium]